MTLTLPPRALYMILCDEVITSDEWPRKHVIVGVTTRVNWPGALTIPLRLPKLVTYLVLTDGRGTASAHLVCFNEETGMEAFRSPTREISFEGKNPAEHHGLIIRLTDGPFPQPGAYVFRFVFADTAVSEQFIDVRETP